MKVSKIFMLLNALLIVCTATAQTPKGGYGPPPSESGKCYAQCLIPGNTRTTKDSLEVKPAWTIPTVVTPAPRTTQTTYTIKEACSTCSFTSEESIVKNEEDVTIVPGYWEYTTTPARWTTVYDTIITRPEEVSYKVYDPKFKDGKHGMGISGRIEKGICRPAKTGNEKREVVIKEACTKMEVADYIWEDETVFVQVKAPTQRWEKRKADANCLSADPEDCLVWCLVDVPEVKERFTKKVKKGCPYGFEDNGEYCVKRTESPEVTKTVKVVTCDEPATFEKAVAISDNFRSIDIKELSKPARYEKMVRKAEYKLITRKVLTSPAKIDSNWVPPVIRKEVITATNVTVTGVIDKTQEVTESCEKTLCTDPYIETKSEGPIFTLVSRESTTVGGFTEWREVLCPADVNSYTIRTIQRALKSRGYDCGPVDNILGAQTKAALTKFQKDNGLPVGQLDFETLRALGIQL
ncbi:MAG: peptidoglycan-binding protein [Saprospiraceae bacterium]|nr:peptidoglycan-binding protein [Saprospiraceae bacterium]